MIRYDMKDVYCVGKPDPKRENLSGAEYPGQFYETRTEGSNMDGMLSHIPVGICKIQINKDLKLLDGNREFYELYGYTPQQMARELNNKIVRTILPDDLPGVRASLKEALESGQVFETEHRMVRRDGQTAWILVRGNFTREDRKDILFCVAIDVSGRKKIEEELRINEERFRIALAQMDNTIFDYDIKTRVMIHAYKSASMYGFDNRMENVPDALVEGKTIHPDSAAVFLEMYAKIRKGEPTASCEVRTRLAEGKYLWRRITMTNIYDSDGNAVHAVGILEDIDAQKRREEELRTQSERDPLTGLYNRRATERYAKKVLKEARGKGSGAMYVIDIDAFKGVNDKYGHVFGDSVLSEAARRMTAVFGDHDVIGRIGGDEFAVFVRDVKEPGRLAGFAQAMCAAFQKDFEHNGIIAKVTCSVGAASFPKDGKTFDELYQKADIALYEAKRLGKDRACVYDSDMGSGMEWSFRSNTTMG